MPITLLTPTQVRLSLLYISYFSLLSFLDVGGINPFFYLDPSPTTPAKRGRGRPKGSKNKKRPQSPDPGVAEGSSAPVPRKRGRPPKVSIFSSFRFPPEPHVDIQFRFAG